MSETVMQSLSILGQGMGGLFAAMLIIMLMTFLLNKIKEKKN